MLKVGVIGIGHLGKIHAKLLREIPEYNLVGVFDTDTAKAQQYSTETGIPFFEHESDLIQACNVIDIVTPTVYHHECAVRAAMAGRHIFIEKPVTATVKEARELIKIIDEANVKVQVGHVERFNQAFMAVQSSIINPMFIETHRLAQFNPRGTDVSVVLDLMIHDIDIVLHTVKSPVKKIYANGVAIVSNTPDIANARIEFANGCVCNLTASRISMKNMRKSRFFQSEAYISVDFLEKKCEIIKIQPAPADLNDPFAMVIDLPNDKGSRLISVEHPPIQEVNAIKHELTLFAHSINNNTTPVVSLADGVRVLETAQQIIDRLQTINV